MVWLSLMSVKRAAISADFFTERASVVAPEIAVDWRVRPPITNIFKLKATRKNMFYSD